MGIAPESWSPSFRRLIRTSNKYLLNPLMLHLAGKRYWYASVIEHTGRQSGKQYSTPIVADRVGECRFHVSMAQFHFSWRTDGECAGISLA